ncbi:MAG: PD40 domain-containing protein, partial [Thermoguttaceae bacterium]|nr:PD40 domain-containing protein [Thermoguttaceae bacterium]
VHNEEEESHHEYYHIYECITDGTGLRQLTDGCYEDHMPAYLPDGNIVFVSSRRKGHPRCFWWGFGERWSTYTVHKMNADGKNIQPLSWHETNEWYPTVSHDGQIFYARWDYIDRDAVTHQNLWSMRPDGTNPTAVWGNASLDIYATFQAKPVPGSRKWLLTAAAHHSLTGGSLVLLDPSVAKDGPQAIERLTPEVPFPEAEGNNIPTFYCSPWPLSEDFCLTSYSPYRLEFEPKPTRDEALGIYVYDRFGNRELLYRDPEIGSDSAQPLAARQTPPVIPSFLPENAPKEGRFFVTDIYQGLGPDVKRGSIKALRIVQIFPKTTIKGNDPAIGLAGEENGRAILGTVPVESDGSVNFVAPACKPLLFQALNEKGEAFQTMRTLTYLQPGEEIACIGCHEDRTSAVGGNAPYSMASRAVGGNAPIAAGRAPSKIDPGKLGGRTFSFSETIQPILNAKCISCHGPVTGTTLPASLKKASEIDLTNAPDGQFSKAYTTLMNRKGLIPRWPQRNRIEVTEPGGENGAIGSGLKKVLADENHKEVKLTDEEWADLAAWIDMNAIFFGTTETEFQKDRLTGKWIPMQTFQ